MLDVKHCSKNKNIFTWHKLFLAKVTMPNPNLASVLLHQPQIFYIFEEYGQPLSLNEKKSLGVGQKFMPDLDAAGSHYVKCNYEIKKYM